jgi:hypothetical protein
LAMSIFQVRVTHIAEYARSVMLNDDHSSMQAG